jgi:spore coat polysaccharide biosynthesis protein SpsF
MGARVFVLIQARMGSSRLPGKVLRRAGEWTLIEHLARRLRRLRHAATLILATTDSPSDGALVEEAARLGLVAWAGPVDDVLARFVQAARHAGASPERGDVLVRVTGDCPLLDPAEVDRLLEEFFAAGASGNPLDYLTNQAGELRQIPRGLDVEVFTAAALWRADAETDSPGDREHVTPWLYRTPGRFKARVSHPEGWSLGHLRLTVDTPEDLEVVQAVVEALGEDAQTAQIAAWLAAHPAVAARNAQIRQKGIDAEMEQRRRRIDGRLLLGRADGGPGLGFGHLARVEALLDAWTSLGGRAALRGVGIGGALRGRLEAAGVALVDVSPEAPADPSLPPERRPLPHADDAQRTLAEAARLGAAAVVTDGYAFDGAWLRAVRASLPMLSVDDLAAFAHPADVILNQNMGFDPARYEATSPGAVTLAGSPFVLFRAELRAALGAPSNPDGPVLLTFGGADLARLSAPVAAALLERLPAERGVVVVAGRAMCAEDQAALAALERAWPTRLRVLYDVAQMAEVLRGASLAVTAAGSTVWELLALGVPPLLVAVAENQRAVCAGVAAAQVGLDLGFAEAVTPAQIAAQADALARDPAARAALAARGPRCIDGRGVWRAIDALLDAMERRAAAPGGDC